MKLSEFLALRKEDIAKIINWVKLQEPKVVDDIQIAASFTTKAITWAKSPQGIAAEAFIASAYPAAAVWEATSIKVLSDLLADMLAVKSVSSLEAIAERLGAELWNLLDGGQKYPSIDGYIEEFQSIFK